MNPLLKMLLLLFSICFFIQVVEVGRPRRNEKPSLTVKNPTDADVKALGEILIKKLEDSLKDCDQTVKNILSCAKTSIQGTRPAAVSG